MKQWFERQKTRACVPHTPYTLVLKFMPSVGRVSGTATHAVGHAGYGLLKIEFQTAFILKVSRQRLKLSESLKQWFEHQKTRACVPHAPYTSVLTFVPHAVGGDAGYGLLIFAQNQKGFN